MMYREKPPSCDNCPWQNVSLGYAAGIGPSNARLAIIAESLGDNEAQQGIPLVGWSGQQVNKFLAEANVKRQEVYLDNVIRCKPLVGTKKKIPKEVVEFCTQQHVGPALELVKPNAIIALGDYSLKYLTGFKSISKYRGSILNTPRGKVIPTYHPSWLIKGEGAIVMYPFVQFDFVKAIEESKFSEYKGPIENFNVKPSFEDVVVFFDKVRKFKKVSFDIETSGGSWWNTAPLCIGFFLPDEAISIPFFDKEGRDYWKTEGEFIGVIELIYGILKNESITKILQNMMYDIIVLESCGFEVK